LTIIVRYEIKKINANGKKSLYCWQKKIRNKYLRQPSIDFDFCNISSSCDVVYKGRWLTQAGYWFILRFCEHFTCLSSKIQNAIKLENISNLITSPSSYQCIRRKTWRLMHFPLIPTHINGMYVCALGIPKCKFSKQMIKKYLVTEYLFITEGKFLF
jgi:hypothetical protein